MVVSVIASMYDLSGYRCVKVIRTVTSTIIGYSNRLVQFRRGSKSHKYWAMRKELMSAHLDYRVVRNQMDCPSGGCRLWERPAAYSGVTLQGCIDKHEPQLRCQRNCCRPPLLVAKDGDAAAGMCFCARRRQRRDDLCLQAHMSREPGRLACRPHGRANAKLLELRYEPLTQRAIGRKRELSR